MTPYQLMKKTIAEAAQQGFIKEVYRAESPGVILNNRYAQSNHYPRCIVCLDGTRRHTFYGSGSVQEARLHRGDIMIIPPQCWINTWYTEDNHALSMVISNGAIRLLNLIGKLPPGQSRYRRGIPTPEIEVPFALPKTIGHLLDVLMTIDPRQTPQFLRRLTACLLEDVARHLPDRVTVSVSKGEQTWSRVSSYVEEHSQEEIDRPTAARELNIHESHISRLFADHGTTFTKFLNQRRAYRARELLKDGSLTAAEVGYLCGFRSANYFGRVFKAETGMSPLNYRAGIR